LSISTIKEEVLKTGCGVRISIRENRIGSDLAIIIAPGFFQSKETKTFRSIEADLAGRFDVISMDYRGHGKSGGLFTFSAKESEDLKAVLDYARERYQRVGVLGFSYGGTIALLEQERYRNIDSIACVSSPMASKEIEFAWWLPRSLKLGYKGLERGAGARIGNPFMDKVNAIDIVEKLSPTPLFFIHGDEDPTVFQRHTDMLYEKSAEPKKKFIFTKASHAEEIYRQYPKLFIKLVIDWFDQTLREESNPI
jgi:pimeloyl-ACP methyl ester carboxylesterase